MKDRYSVFGEVYGGKMKMKVFLGICRPVIPRYQEWLLFYQLLNDALCGAASPPLARLF